MIKKADAIRSINPNIILSQNGDEFTIHNDEKMPSDSEIEAKITELQADYDAQAYARTRKPLYPAIGDQLDALYHAGVFPKEMADKIKAVKDANAKE